MKKIILLFAVTGSSFALLCTESEGRGRGGGFAAGGRSFGGASIGSYGGGGFATRSGGGVVGPYGGSAMGGRASGSYTTQRGGTIDYRGAGIGGTTPGGISGGRYVGGVNVTTAGGRDLTHVGAGRGAIGPGGNAIAGKSGATIGSGPAGSFGTRYQGGVAIGPHTAVAGGTRYGAAAGPGGTIAGGTRYGAAAVGPYGAVAGRTTFAAGGHGTYYRSTAAVRSQGVYVRGAVATYPCFRPNWYRQYPSAWFAAGWVANSVWRATTWDSCASYCGYAETPIYYDYGSTVVYEDNRVIINGEPAGSAEDYAKQAVTLADTGRDAKASKDDDWLPLGVFAMVQGDEKTSNNIFQLAINKQGVLRGNYYDAFTDSTSLVYGSVDKKTQRAAWTVGDRKTPIYEVGVANLTKDETTMMVHYGTDRSVQFTLVRIEESDQKKD